MTLESSHLQAVPSKPASPVEGPLRPHTHTYDLMRQCIHCGFCLPTCPTYAVLGVEMDSPRGRIYQMQAIADGRMAISPEFVDHMYCCLGCRACETACPSGVQFGKLIEAAREQIQLDVAHLPLNGNYDVSPEVAEEDPKPEAHHHFPYMSTFPARQRLNCSHNALCGVFSSISCCLHARSHRSSSPA